MAGSHPRRRETRTVSGGAPLLVTSRPKEARARFAFRGAEQTVANLNRSCVAGERRGWTTTSQWRRAIQRGHDEVP